jgi:pyrroloquinoline quinone (PQQ) biosynthesis protein C
MSSDLFKAFDKNMRRQFMANLVAHQRKLSNPGHITLNGIRNQLYRPSDEVIATATPATIAIEAVATVRRLAKRQKPAEVAAASLGPARATRRNSIFGQPRSRI